jgi:hypothetical protein
MAFVAGKGARILVGVYNLGPYLQNASFSLTKDALETTTFQDGSRDYIEGLKNGTATLSGLFDPAASASDVILNAVFSDTATEAVSIFLGNDAVTTPGYVTDGWQGSYELGAAFDGLVTVGASIQASSDGTAGRPGSWQRALSMVPYAAYTGIQTFTAADNVTGTTAGGVATIHATAHTGTNTTIIVESSPDNVSWTPHVTFTVSAATSSRTFIASGVSIGRYVRGRISAIGTSTTAHVNFARF